MSLVNRSGDSRDSDKSSEGASESSPLLLHGNHSLNGSYTGDKDFGFCGRKMIESEKNKKGVHCCAICCTIFSTIAAIILFLIGLYANAGWAYMKDSWNSTQVPTVKQNAFYSAALYGALGALSAFSWFYQSRRARRASFSDYRDFD